MDDQLYYRDEKVEVAPAVDWSVLGERKPDGIYFDLPEGEYRSAGAVSASLLKDVTISPLTAWCENIDSTLSYKSEDTDAQDEGTALHKRLLEGDAVFREHCAVRPENDGSYIEGAAELKARCKELGLKVGGTIPELCARIRDADPDAKLWPEVMAEFKEASDGKIILKPDQWSRLELRARLVRMHPSVRNAFEGGFPEVSIFWTDADGMPCKARVDYLKIASAIDLKYFANVMKRPIAEAVNAAIRSHRIQARWYKDGLAAARVLARNGKVFGAAPDSKWIEAFAAGPEHRFFWVFVQKGPVPEVECVEFSRTLVGGASDNAYWTRATDQIARAKIDLLNCLATYADGPWLAPRPVRALQDEDQPDLLWRN